MFGCFFYLNPGPPTIRSYQTYRVNRISRVSPAFHGFHLVELSENGYLILSQRLITRMFFLVGWNVCYRDLLCTSNI